MAVKIKLTRLGKIRNPQYRIAVADARNRRDGRAIEVIGRYHPKEEPSLIEVVTSATNGKVFRNFLVPVPEINGFRVMLDVELDPQGFTYFTCKLMQGGRPLTETWSYSWKVYNF